jgi:deoxyribodipyrimidine photo-lyase
VRTLVWFRGKDLRLADHEPLAAARAGGEVVPLFVLDPHFFAPDRAARLAPRMQFLLASLAELEASIAAAGSRLLVVPGRSVEVVPRLARELRCDRVVAHRWTEPFARERDRRVAAGLGAIPLELFEGETLAPPETLRNGSGQPFVVYSAFARAFRAQVEVAAPLPRPRALPPLPAGVDTATVPVPTLADLGLAANPRILPGGEAAGRARLTRFARGHIPGYVAARDDLADTSGTTRLSADLKFGIVSARTVWTTIADARRDPLRRDGADKLLSEILWREFSHATLWDRPDVLTRPFRRAFEGFPWRTDRDDFAAWAEGRTGYPVVDAAARQLLAEGYVHNRARMIAASFLAKHLLLDFRMGEAHYLEHLVDGDWAQNDMGWQWSAGCGCDAQPWFRVFHPVLQGQKHDAAGVYVKRWLPELAELPAKHVHAPWEAPPELLARAGVVLGVTYPRPIVDHKLGRARFLDVARAHLGSPG